jgi:hypothetical protein
MYLLWARSHLQGTVDFLYASFAFYHSIVLVPHPPPFGFSNVLLTCSFFSFPFSILHPSLFLGFFQLDFLNLFFFFPFILFNSQGLFFYLFFLPFHCSLLVFCYPPFHCSKPFFFVLFPPS